MRVSVLVLICLATPLAAAAQTLSAEARTVLGDWTVQSDETGEAQAVVRLVEERGRVVGRIVRVLPTRAHPVPSPICGDCRGAYRGADLRHILLVRDMRWNGDEFAGGRIVDPEKDRTYRATMRLDGPDRLRLRGYIGIRALGRTQVWTRVR